MLGSGKTGRVRTSATAATASSVRSRDSYQRYAVVLYRQALLAPRPGRGEDDARYHLAESVFRRCHRLVAGSARQDRRAGLFGGLGYIRARRVPAASPAAAVEDSPLRG